MSRNIKIEKLPTSVEEFIEIRNNLANTPQGGAAVFIIALKLQSENPSLGEQCTVIATDRSKLAPGNIYKDFQVNNFDMRRIKEQLKRYPYIANSYFVGATPENGYSFKTPTEIICSSNPHSGNENEGYFKIFVKSSGADSPRPISLEKNNRGIWKAKEWSSIIMGIIPPKIVMDDDL